MLLFRGCVSSFKTNLIKRNSNFFHFRDGSGEWVGGSLSDTALVWCDLNVAVGAPSSSPGVLDEEVILTAFSSVANSENTVIKSITASRGDNSGMISLEDELIGLDGNRDWSLVEGCSELGACGVNSDITVTGDCANSLGSDVIASSFPGRVWVCAFLHQGIALDVCESVVHETTVAAIVLLRAVDQLLLG